MEKEDKVVIDTSLGLKDGQLKCPNCGASEIQPNPKTGKLKCVYCACEFDGEETVEVKDLKKLKGMVVGSGTNDINKEADSSITIRCGGCGAEIVFDTSESVNARCHWCRSILSINNKLENGAIPDMILPFSKKKEEAQKSIDEFVSKRRFFANPVFKREFTTNNIMGVYFPYMLVDANCHATFEGVGEHLVKTYTRGTGDDKKTYYDADAYNVKREFDITIDDLCIESNSVRLDKSSNTQTNNIINSIMPFDTENCIKYKPNYLIGYTSERRDVNVSNLENKVNKQLKDVAKFAVCEDIKFYDRGVRWTRQDLEMVGTQWMAAYLPVWLYSYQEVKGNKKILHYVAVNARTGETMGSVPINTPLLFGISAIIEFIVGGLGLMLYMSVNEGSDDNNGTFFLLFLASGFIFYFVMYSRYRNKEARHNYEVETKNQKENLICSDEFMEKRTRLTSSTIVGKNDHTIEGEVSIDLDKSDKKE